MNKRMTNKRTLILTALIATIVAAFSLVGCGGGNKQLSVSITNKDALTAAWVEGEADRTVEVKLSPDSYTLENTNVIVESSNSDVVDVDGFALKAVGGGTATVTVRAGDATDKVEITVTPSLKGVRITNKAALGESWVIGSADRTVELAFDPNTYDINNTNATIVSSNTNVVTVSGTTLHAVAIGTAKITITAGAFTDEVTIAVRPAIESLTVTNKADLEEEWAIGTERTIEAAFVPDEYTVANTTPTITVEPAGAVEVVNGWKIKAKAVGAATVTVSAQGKTDTFEINVAHAAPVISLSGPGLTQTEEGGTMSSMQDTNLTLPTATAMTTDGVNVTTEIDVTYSDEDKLHISGLLMTPEIGTYTITYTVANPADTAKIATKTITITVFRQVFSWTDATWQVLEEKVANAEQKVTTTNHGYQTAQFNLAASRYYYAEATFHITEWSNVGIANFVPDNNHTRWLSAVVQTSGDVNYKFADYDTSKFNGGAWSLQENEANGITILNQYRLTEYGNLNASTDGTHKVAILRLGDTYYSFWNDQYVDSAVFEYYADVETIPGFFTLGLDESKGYATAIDYFSGKTAVEAKLNALTHNGKDFIRSYVPDSWAGDSKNIDNRNFTKNDTTEERGINFDFTKNDAHFNGGMVSPYVWFDGDFTFSWDHKATSTTGKSRQMILEMRSRMWYNDTRVGGIQFGAEYNDDASLNRFLLNGNALAKDYKKYEPGAGTDGSAGSRFTISRKLFDDYAEITLTAQSLANPAQKFTRVITLGKTADKSTDGTTAFDGWNEPVILQWHNTGVAGQYSNIGWTARSAQRIESLAIDNKTALTAAWVEGEADRTVEVTLAPAGYALANTKYSITSSNPEAVAVNGATLSAVGGGTATITVSVGFLTDSFEVTVTPSLKSVTITNKASLVSWREDEEATRSLELAFSPADVYNFDNSDVSIVSNNPEVVSVDGTTLTRVGRGVATITVTAKGGVTDEVTISVLPPAIQTITVANKTALEEDWECGTDRTINATFDPSDYNTTNTTPTITCDPVGAIEVVEGWTIRAKAVGTATVTVEVQGKTDTFTINVIHGTPALTLRGDGLTVTEDGGTMEAMQGTALDLPTAVAFADGANITDRISITYSDEAKLNISGGKMTPEVGEYTVTYTVANPDDASKSVTKTVTINVYRTIFSWTDNTWNVTEAKTTNANQKVATKSNGFQMAQFNIEASDYYYAEATFKTSDYRVVGVANIVPADDYKGRMLISVMPTTGNADYKLVDFNPASGGWDLSENNTDKNIVLYQYQVCNQGGLTRLGKDGDKDVTKMAVIRAGKMFYMFYNDQYIGATDMDHYASANTIPGLFVYGMSTADVVTGIDYFSGKTAVEAKLNVLTHNGKDFIRQYVPTTTDWGFGDSQNTDNKNFTTNEITDDRGINFDFTKADASFNGSCVSPFLYFDGDFTFSWDYKATSTTGSESRMIVEMRTLIGYDHNSCGGIQFGAQYESDASLNRYLLGGAGLAEGHKWHEPGAGTDATAGSRFTISRKIHEDYAEITLTVTSLTDPTKTFTRTINIGATADKSTDGTTAFEGWNRVVILQWHNTCVAGQYSNVTWSADAP